MINQLAETQGVIVGGAGKPRPPPAVQRYAPVKLVAQVMFRLKFLDALMNMSRSRFGCGNSRKQQTHHLSAQTQPQAAATTPKPPEHSVRCTLQQFSAANGS